MGTESADPNKTYRSCQGDHSRVDAGVVGCAWYTLLFLAATTALAKKRIKTKLGRAFAALMAFLCVLEVRSLYCPSVLSFGVVLRCCPLALSSRRYNKPTTQRDPPPDSARPHFACACACVSHQIPRFAVLVDTKINEGEVSSRVA